MKKIIVSITLILMLTFLSACGANTETPADSGTTGNETQSEPIVIKAAHTLADVNIQSGSYLKFKEVVEQKTNGRYKVEIFPAGSMGSDGQILEKTQMGALEVGYSSTSNLANVVPEWATFDLPYIIDDYLDHMNIFYEDGKLGGPVFEKLDMEMQKKGLKILWIMPANFRNENTIKEVILPDDLKGLKIRTTSSPVEIAIQKAFGANTVSMGFSEVYNALQQKTIDGLGQQVDAVYDMKLHEVVRYINCSKCNAMFPVVPVNLEWYNSLPEDIREIIDEAGIEATKASNEIWEDAVKEKTDAIIEAGVKVHIQTEEETQIWKDKAQPVWDEFVPQIGEDWVKLVQERAAK